MVDTGPNVVPIDPHYSLQTIVPVVIPLNRDNRKTRSKFASFRCVHAENAELMQLKVYVDWDCNPLVIPAPPAHA